MITLHVLGSLDLRDASGREVASILTQPKTLAVLCYLALARPRGFHRRDTLIALFWPELDQERARAALRQTLYRLRQALGEEIIRSRGSEDLSINREIVDCDALTFEHNAEHGAAEAATRAYCGELLAGFFIDASPEFEQWLDLERVQLQQRAREMAWQLSEQRAARGEAFEAVRWARHALSLAPGDEQSLRRLMRLLDKLDDRAAALRAYQEFSHALESEYGVEPSAETRSLLEQMRARQHAAVQAPMATSLEDAGPAPSPLVQPRSHKRAALANVFVTLVVATAAGQREDSASAMVDPEIQRTFLEGKYFAGQITEPALLRAIASFETIVRRAPDYAAAHVELGRAYLMLALAHGRFMSTEALTHARRAADAALALDSKSAAAYDLRALIAEYDWDWNLAERHRLRAIQLDAGAASIWQNHAQFLNGLGRSREAIAAIETAHKLEPLSRIIRADAAVTYWMAGDFRAAILWAQRALDLDSLFHPALWIAGEAQLALGDTAAGIRYIERAAAIAKTPGFTGLLGVAYARSGRRADAETIAAMLRANEAAPWVAVTEAMIWGWLGQRDQAFEWLRWAVAQRDPNLPWSIKQNPGWDPLRSDARFRQVLNTIALPPH